VDENVIETVSTLDDRICSMDLPFVDDVRSITESEITSEGISTSPPAVTKTVATPDHERQPKTDNGRGRNFLGGIIDRISSFVIHVSGGDQKVEVTKDDIILQSDVATSVPDEVSVPVIHPDASAPMKTEWQNDRPGQEDLTLTAERPNLSIEVTKTVKEAMSTLDDRICSLGLYVARNDNITRNDDITRNEGEPDSIGPSVSVPRSHDANTSSHTHSNSGGNSDIFDCQADDQKDRFTFSTSDKSDLGYRLQMNTYSDGGIAKVEQNVVCFESLDVKPVSGTDDDETLAMNFEGASETSFTELDTKSRLTLRGHGISQSPSSDSASSTLHQHMSRLTLTGHGTSEATSSTLHEHHMSCQDDAAGVDSQTIEGDEHEGGKQHIEESKTTGWLGRLFASFKSASKKETSQRVEREEEQEQGPNVRYEKDVLKSDSGPESDSKSDSSSSSSSSSDSDSDSNSSDKSSHSSESGSKSKSKSKSRKSKRGLKYKRGAGDGQGTDNRSSFRSDLVLHGASASLSGVFAQPSPATERHQPKKSWFSRW
jgi:hypothetical protein